MQKYCKLIAKMPLFKKKLLKKILNGPNKLKSEKKYSKKLNVESISSRAKLSWPILPVELIGGIAPVQLHPSSV
jgi:hypothetical protein